MTSWGKLALIFSLALTGARGQEDDDDTTLQYPTAFDQDSVGNSGNESAVAAISFNDKLYVAINTQKSLDGANVGGDDTTDIVIRSFDTTDLDEEAGAQFGGDMDDTIRDIARNSDQYYVVIVGSTESETDHLFDLDTPTGAMDWFIASLDPDDFELVSAYVNGTKYDNQEATAVAIASDGSVIVAGWTWGEYFEENAGSDNSGDVGYDAWVLKISVDLEDLGTLTEDDFEWGIQFGTVAYDTPQKIILDSDDNIYVIGTTADNSDVLTDDEEDEVQAMFVYKLDPDDGDTVWSATTELGFLSDGSAAYGAVLSEDESELYISGNTRGIIGNFSGSTTDSDELFLVSLDVDSGDINWVWQSESNATVFGTGGVVLAEDGSPIVGGIAFGNQFNLSYEYWEFGSGDMIAAKIDTDLLEVVKYFTATAASNETREQPWAMVKDDNEDDGVFLIGYEDGDFEDEDVDPDDNDLNYLVLKVELDELPEEEEEGGDDDYDFPYWYVGVPVFGVGILAFVCAYKCAESSQRALQKKATMI